MPEFSSSDRRRDVEAQLGRLVVYAHKHGFRVMEAVSEIGSGLNGPRPKLKKLLANPKVQAIVEEHRDCWLRFGAKHVEAALAAQGRKLVVVERSEVKDDLVQDTLEVLTYFCARSMDAALPAIVRKKYCRSFAKKLPPSRVPRPFIPALIQRGRNHFQQLTWRFDVLALTKERRIPAFPAESLNVVGP